MILKNRFLSWVCPGLMIAAYAGAADTGEYISPGATGTAFPGALREWKPDMKWCDDENFYISRVSAAGCFRYSGTQIDPTLTEDQDKKLIFWTPVGDAEHSAHPAGRFDRETFTQWSYVTHYGVWNAPLAHVPAGFMDAAHRNGVAVSAVAPIPFGNITAEWSEALETMIEAGPEKMAAWLNRCGLDGIGYNSEFTASPDLVGRLSNWHMELHRAMNSPLKEIIWYDGTCEQGYTIFDSGLGTHNDEIWGGSGNERTSLFFNYNWNDPGLLNRSVTRAAALERTPLDLYCGINMQGREPRNLSRGLWSLLRQYPLSIGLWGAHGANMFWESRAERGGSIAERQRHYLSGLERWFAGGTRNPMTARHNLLEKIAYGPGNEDFPGMSSMMTARSPMSWDLSERPFITSFCLGNGRYLNLRGERQHSSEWYDMGAQDYLPTWTWWWAPDFLGRDPEGMSGRGLLAEYSHDDAWTGGNSVRICGSASEEWLHLFKTRFKLKRDDEIIIRLKLLSGTGQVSLALCTEGNEKNPFLFPLDIESGRADWQEFVLTLDGGVASGDTDGNVLAMIALRFEDIQGLDLRLGSVELSRPSAGTAVPPTPEIERAEVMAAGPRGAVGKLIYHLPDEESVGPYNLDHGVSRFNLYARRSGEEAQLRGFTSPWAALMYNIPGEWDREESRLELGVSAVGLDGVSESAVAWSRPLETAPMYVEEVIDEESAPELPRQYGALPEIVSLTVSKPEDESLVILTGEVDVPLTVRSRGVKIGKSGYGFAYADAGLAEEWSGHSISFRIKTDAPDDGCRRCLSVLRDRSDSWASNHFGSFRHILEADGSTNCIILTGESLGDMEYYFDSDTRLLPGRWYHMTYTFDTDGKGGVRPLWFLDGKLQKPVKRVRGRHTYTDGEIPYENHIKTWRAGNVFETGSYVHGLVPADGAVACMRFYSTPLLTEESVAREMTRTATDDIMTPIAYHDTGTEGVGEMYRPTPKYCGGPLLDFGEDYLLPTDISWRVSGGRLMASETEYAEAGRVETAFVAPDSEGDCVVTLTVRNEFGEDRRDITLGESGITEVMEQSVLVWPNPFTDSLTVRTPHEGSWTVTLTDATGRRVLAQTFRTGSDDCIRIYPDVTAGLYLLTLMGEEGKACTERVIRR